MNALGFIKTFKDKNLRVGNEKNVEMKYQMFDHYDQTGKRNSCMERSRF